MEKAKRKQILIIMILAGIAILCAAVLLFYFLRQRNQENQYEQLRQENTQTVEIPDEEDVPDLPEDEKQPSYDGIPEVDFEALREKNTDVCAWILVPGTGVDYPVLQNASSDNPYDDYYLNHTIDGTEGRPGAIYIEPGNSADFMDFNTVIYGHNMKNKTMFGTLHAFEEESFFEEQEYIYLVTPEKSLIYRIFASVVYDDRHILASYDFKEQDQRQAFLDSLLENGNEGDYFKEEIAVTPGDQLLTLSTCVSNQKDKRLLIIGVLTEEIKN